MSLGSTQCVLCARLIKTENFESHVITCSNFEGLCPFCDSPLVQSSTKHFYHCVDFMKFKNQDLQRKNRELNTKISYLQMEVLKAWVIIFIITIQISFLPLNSLVSTCPLSGTFFNKINFFMVIFEFF